MEYSSEFRGREREIIELFTRTFTDSEGAAEGQLIGALVRNLLGGTAEKNLFAFTASEDEKLVGAAIFSRLIYDQDPRNVFILSPMAVATDRQGQGIGQGLLSSALSVLRDSGIDVVITYGDPAFYGKVGFTPLSEQSGPPPLPLSQPEGWIGQSLTTADIAPLRGHCTCVAALNDPALW